MSTLQIRESLVSGKSNFYVCSTGGDASCGPPRWKRLEPFRGMPARNRVGTIRDANKSVLYRTIMIFDYNDCSVGPNLAL